MQNVKDARISATEKNRLLIKNVNDRPNAMATFGKAKLTPTDTKDLFDKQFELVVERHNALCDFVEEAASTLGDINNTVGNLDAALDEVHAYAEEIIGGTGV